MVKGCVLVEGKEAMQDEMSEMRVDKWLWAARFFKTRALAQEAVELGRVRILGQRMKPARSIRIGDRLQIDRAEEHFDVYVEALSALRGSASLAQKLFRETDESKAKREHARLLKKFSPEPSSSIDKGRPTKRDARRLRALKESWS